MNINWFPGHMAKTKRLISENLKLIDVIVEILDARIPYSSKNPDMDSLIGNKPRLFVLNKADMADDKITDEWISYYKKNGFHIIKTIATDNKGTAQIITAVTEILKDKIERYKEKGMNYSLKMMIVGVPNVGKSSIINKLSKKSSAKTGDRPGVTKGKQWVRLQKGLELLDTPGVLWPKFEDQEVGKKLAYTGAIKDEILDMEELCFHFITFLKERYPNFIKERYKIDFDLSIDSYDLMLLIGKKRGFVVSGGEIDTLRVSNMILDEFRSLKTGRITLERPGDYFEFN